MGSTKLYDRAIEKFRKTAQDRYADAKDQQLLAEFIRDRCAAEDARDSAKELELDARGKYDIPPEWVKNLLGNIDTAISIGNAVLSGGPESVGIVWLAVKVTLGAIQSNFKLYQIFGSGLTDICEILVLVPHYDKLYDEKADEDEKASPMISKLFDDIIDTYVAIFFFSFTVKRHLDSRSLARLRHGLKDFFGVEQDKFQGRLNDISRLKSKVIEDSQAVFEDRSLTHFRSIQADVKTTIQKIQSFEPELAKLQKSQAVQVDIMTKGFQDVLKELSVRDPWRVAMQKFDKNTKELLDPLERTSAALIEALEQKHEGTCSWINKDSNFVKWKESNENAMICLEGRPGTGKSVLLAAIADSLSLIDDPTQTLIYVSCKTIRPDTSGKATRAASKITSTLLHQLYRCALPPIASRQDTVLLEACNKIFESRKQEETGGKVLHNKSDNIPDFTKAFPALMGVLKRNTIVVIDAVDILSETDQEGLFASMHQMIQSRTEQRARIIVACRSSTPYVDKAKSLDSSTFVDVGDNIKDDMDRVLSTGLNVVPGLSQEEQQQAKTAILAKAKLRFGYLSDVAIPFMQEPFTRPLSKRLESLPSSLSDTYDETLKKMMPNYVSLLRHSLTWSLLSFRPPKVEEVMEDFYGVYKTSSKDLDNNQADNDESFPPSTQLEINQLRTATNAFLDLNPHDGTHYLEVQDREQLWDFCMTRQHLTDLGPQTDGICSRCRQVSTSAQTLHIDERQGHLELVLTFLTHMNNPLFQSRAQLQPETSTALLSENNTLEDATQTDKETSGTSPDEPVKESSSEPSDRNQESTANNLDELELAKLDDEESNQAIVDVNNKELDDTKSEWTEDGEDVDLNFVQTIKEPATEGDGEDLDPVTRSFRYEMRYWPLHLEKAEKLWTDDEQDEDELWAKVMEQLDLFTGNKAVYKKWYETVAMEQSPPELEPLCQAAYFGLTRWARHLLNQGAKPTNLQGGVNSVQYAAAVAEKRELLQMLLEHSGDDYNMNTETNKFLSPFHQWLMTDSSVENIKFLLGLGANPSFVNQYGSNALHYLALTGNDPEALEVLLAYTHEGKPPDINVQDKGGNTPLHHLLSRQPVPIELLQAFVDHGADVNVDNEHSVRPLQVACTFGELKALEIMWPKITIQDDDDNDGDTALHQAAASGHSNCITFLVQNGAGFNLCNKKGWTALHFAAKFGHADCVQALVDHPGIDLNIADKHDRTALFFACSSSSQDAASTILAKLIENKVPMAEINQSTTRRSAPFGRAAARGHADVVNTMIKYARESNAQDDLLVDQAERLSEMSPLHHAAARGCLASVQALLELDINGSLTDKEGRTPLAISCEQWSRRHQEDEFEDIISLLIQRYPSVAINDQDVVATCAANGSMRLIEQLHAIHADLSRRDKYLWSPLDLARKHRHQEVEDYLKRQAAWERMLPSKWVTFNKKVVLAEDGKCLSYAGGGHLAISADKPLPAELGRYYFEITIEDWTNEDEKKEKQYPEVAIGFCNLGGATLDFPGWPASRKAPSALSWAYHSDDGSLRCSSWMDNQAEIDRNHSAGVGDTMGCGVDVATNSLWFTKNQERFEVEFPEVHGRLFPVIGLSSAVKLRSKFVPPFKWVDDQ